MFILPPDENAERWTGARIRAQEVESMAGIQKCRYISEFGSYLKGVLTSLKADTVCLDFDRFFEDEQPKEAFVLAEIIKKDYPYINLRNIHNIRPLPISERSKSLAKLKRCAKQRPSTVKALSE